MAKKQNKLVKEETLETILFNCRNSLRGRAAMTDKRDLLLTLVFLKFIGERLRQQKEKIRHEIMEVQSINDTDFIELQLSRPDQYMKDGVLFLTDETFSSLTGVAIAFDTAIKTLDDSNTQEIRKWLIENDKVKAIIVLPRNMFYSTDIFVTLWILNNNKKGSPWHGRQLRDRTGEILFIDLRTWNNNTDEKKYVRLSETEIDRVCQIYLDWQTESFVEYAELELYYAAHCDEIQEKGYSLVPSRYIEFIDCDTEIDYKSALLEQSCKFDELKKRWDANEMEFINAFKVLGYGKE